MHRQVLSVPALDSEINFVQMPPESVHLGNFNLSGSEITVTRDMASVSKGGKGWLS